MKVLPRLLLSFVLAVALTAQAQAPVLPAFSAVRGGYLSSDALLVDRAGLPLADRRFDAQVRRLAWVELQGLPTAMREALLVAEDKRFFEHGGVDWIAFAGAVWQNLWGTRRGASTLTMQLAGLLDPALALPNRGRERRSLGQKWDQAAAAIELERHWSKPQILEAYLNLAPFRGDLQGIAAASEVLFGLPTAQLTRREAVILAALLRGPNARPALVAQRACTLAGKLGSARLCPEITRLAQARLDAPRNQPRHALAPHLAARLLTERGQRVPTLLDAGMQQTLLTQLRATGQAGSAAVLIDNSNGAVLAWVGGLTAGEPDGVSRTRRVGQWWWPHLAALALERGVVSAASLLPTPQSGQSVAPGGTLAPRSLRTALREGHEGALHALAQRLPLDLMNERLLALGLSPPPNLLFPEPLAEASLLQLTGAWRSLAGGGSYVPPRLQEQDNGFRSLGGAGGPFVVLDALAIMDGTGWRAQWHGLDAEAQCVVVGSTSRLSLGLVQASVRGDCAAAGQAWQRALAAVSPEPSPPPIAPIELESVVVSFEPPVEPARREWLLRGHAPEASFSAVGIP